MIMPRKRKNENIHRNRVRKATHPELALMDDVEIKFLELTKSCLRITGQPLVVPDRLRKDFVLWREARVRHKQVIKKNWGLLKKDPDAMHRLIRKGEFGVSYDECEATKRIAQWTLDVNNEIRNQPIEKLDCLREGVEIQ